MSNVLAEVASRRAAALLEDHRRVRDAAKARGTYEIRALTPVDVVAGALAADVLACPGPTEPLVAHYFNPVTVTYPQLAAALAAQGFAVELVPYAQWWDALRTAIGAAPLLAIVCFAVIR